VRNVIGEKEFNKLRGQAISAHSQSERSPGCGRVFDLVAPRATPAHATLHPTSHARLLLTPHTPHPRPTLCTAVIKEFGKTAGVDNKQVQGVVRLAKKNGEFLGFLA